MPLPSYATEKETRSLQCRSKSTAKRLTESHAPPRNDHRWSLKSCKRIVSRAKMSADLSCEMLSIETIVCQRAANGAEEPDMFRRPCAASLPSKSSCLSVSTFDACSIIGGRVCLFRSNQHVRSRLNSADQPRVYAASDRNQTTIYRQKENRQAMSAHSRCLDPISSGKQF